MTSQYRRFLFSLFVFLLFFFFSLPPFGTPRRWSAWFPAVYAADIEAVLDSANGSSGFSVQDSGTTEMMHIDSDGNLVIKGCFRLDSGGTECTTAQFLIVDGNVGIGTTVPRAFLEIGSGGSIGTIDGSNDIFVLGDIEIDGIYYGNGAGLTGLGSASIDDDSLDFNKFQDTLDLDATTDMNLGASNFIIDLDSTGDFIIQDGGTGTHIFDDTGNVGIGTTVPITTLQINQPGGFSATPADFNANREAVYISRHTNNVSLAIGAGTGHNAGLYLGDSDSALKGRVSYSNTSDALSLWANGSQRLTIDSTGNVGIGSTAPRALLEIGSGGTLGTIDGTNDLFVLYDIEIDGTYYGDGSGLTGVGSASIGDDSLDFAQFTDSMTLDATTTIDMDTNTADLNFDGGTLYIDNAGLIGIGTTAPIYQLDLFGTFGGGGVDARIGNSSGAARLTLQSTSNSTNDFQFADPDSSTVGRIRYNHADNSLTFRNNSSDNVVIDSSGNVGIGTTGPVVALDVVGNALFSSSIGIGANSPSGTTQGIIFPNSYEIEDLGANQGLVFSSKTDMDAVSVSIRRATDSSPTKKILEVTNRANTSSFFTVDSTGNVGIGSTAPRAKLEIGSGGTLGTIDGTNDLFVLDDIEIDGTYYGDGSGLTGVGSASIGDDSLDFAQFTDSMTLDATTTIDMDTNTADLNFDSNTFFIDSSANSVGIGAIPPTTSLEVQGSDGSTFISVKDTRSTVGDLAGIRFGTNHATLNFKSFISHIETGANGLGDLVFVVDSNGDIADAVIGDEKMRIDANGNVGIGTTSPPTLLAIQDDSNNDLITLNGPNSTLGTIGASSLGNGGIAINSVTTGDELRLQTQGTDRITILSTGLVGVGDVLPANTLSVSGNASVGTGYDRIAAPTNGLIVEGNVGIGTTEPQGPLHVLINGVAGTPAIPSTTGIVSQRSATTDALSSISIIAGNQGESRLNFGDTDAETTGRIEYHHDTNHFEFAMPGNLGIGTAAAQALLEIGSGGTLGTIDGTNDLFVLDDIEIDGTYYGDGSGLTGVGSAAISDDSLDFAQFTDSMTLDATTTIDMDTNTADLNFDSNTFVIDSSANNVGIGSTAPTAPLDIAASIPYINFTDTDISGPHQIRSSNNQFLIRADPSNASAGSNIAFDVDGTEHVRINANGNVGIGSTAPRALLEIGAAGTLGTIDGTNDLFVLDDIEIDGTYYGDGSGLTGVGSASIADDSLDFDKFTDAMTVDATTTIDMDTNTADLNFDSGTFFIDSSANNVGIGTTTPRALLDVEGADSPEIQISENTGNIGDYGALTLLSTAAGGKYAQIRGLFSAAGDADIAFFTSTDGSASLPEKMRITDDGNVGIGTTTVDRNLHVYENNTNSIADPAFVIEQESTGDAGLQFLITGATAWDIGIDNSDSDKLKIQTPSTSDFSNALFTIQTDGNVGIGTTAPGNLLHLQGSVGILTVEDTNSTAILQLTNSVATPAADTIAGTIQFRGEDDGGDAQGYARIHGVVTDDTATSEDGYLVFDTMEAGTLTEQMRIDNVGNVGIGIAAPTERLHVYQNDSQTVGPAIIEQDGTGDAGLIFQLTGGQAWTVGIDNSNSDSFNLGNGTAPGSSPAITVLTDGNVGIGTTTPDAILNVWSSSSSGDYFKMERDNTSSYTVFNFGGGDAVQTFSIDGGADIYSIGLDDDDDDKFKISYSATLGTSDRLIINSGGNVGIGTTVPEQLVHIRGSTARLLVEDTDTAAILQLTNSVATPAADTIVGTIQLRGEDDGGASQSYARIHGVVTDDTATSEDGYLVFDTMEAGTLTEQMRIDNVGNVGIGETNPVANLDVAGTISADTWVRTISGGVYSGNSVFYFTTSAGNNKNIQHSGNDMLFHAADTTPQMVIDGDGDLVGIGTTAPSRALEVVTSNTTGGLITGTSDSTTAGAFGIITAYKRKGATAPAASDEAGITFDHDDSGGARQEYALIAGGIEDATATSEDGYISFETTSAGTTRQERMRITSVGNVGIGTTVPNAPLAIDNNVATGFLDNFSEYQMLLWTGGTAAASYGIGIKGSTMVFNSGVGAYSFDDAGTSSSMVIDANGNVGIGTTVPAFELDVDGVIRAQAVALSGDVLRAGNDSKIVDVDVANTMGIYGLQDTTQGHILLGSSGPVISGVSGNVGIGTTVPTADLHVVWSAGVGVFVGDLLPFGTAMFETNLNSGNTHLWFAEGGTRVFSITNGGLVTIAAPTTANTTALCWDNSGESAIFDCNGSATDLAENFGVDDFTIESGDIVAVDLSRGAESVFQPDGEGTLVLTSRAWVSKAKKTIDGKDAPIALGVISSQPNIVFGEDGVFDDLENPQPVSLAGRVPVKVSLENGPIRPGDPITTSSVPGVGMKATEPGRVIGIALEPFDQGDHLGGVPADVAKIVLFINPHWWGGDIGETVTTMGEAVGKLQEDNASLHAELQSLKIQIGQLRAAVGGIP